MLGRACAEAAIQIWLGSLALSAVCALFTVSVLRGSNSWLKAYFFFGLFLGFVIANLLLAVGISALR